MSRFEGMTAIVTGAADNIGRATAQMLARDGAKVVVGYHSNADGAAETVKLIEGAGGHAVAQRVDQTQEADVRALVQCAVDTYGALHILVNNAAATTKTDSDKDVDIVNMDPDYWDHAMRVNLKGPMMACKFSIPQMIRAGYGSIINIGSGSAFRGDARKNAYATAKLALQKLTMDVATAYGKENVRSNLLVSGLILTNAARRNLTPEGLALYASQNLTPFIGEPDDIADVACFLASRNARYITGQTLVVDGGFLTHQCHIGNQ